MPQTEPCVQGMENKTRINNLVKDMDDFKDTIRAFEADIWKAVNDIKNDLVHRPSWTVTLWITGCTSTTLAMLVYVLTHILGKG